LRHTRRIVSRVHGDPMVQIDAIKERKRLTVQRGPSKVATILARVPSPVERKVQ
jgi:hypothetical protein